MTDETSNLVLEMLRAIREEQAVTSLKIGSMAENMVSMRRGMDDLKQHVDKLDGSINVLRSDVRMIAMAVDQHTSRLERMESHLDVDNKNPAH